MAAGRWARWREKDIVQPLEGAKSFWQRLKILDGLRVTIVHSQLVALHMQCSMSQSMDLCDMSAFKKYTTCARFTAKSRAYSALHINVQSRILRETISAKSIPLFGVPHSHSGQAVTPNFCGYVAY